MSEKQLLNAFPPISGKEWREKIEADLKGADFTKKLVWRTEEGFEVQPYYRSEDLERLSGVLAGTEGSVLVQSKGLDGNPWRIHQEFGADISPEACNCTLVAALGRGVSSIGVDLAAYGKITQEKLEKLFQEVDLSTVAVEFRNMDDPGDTLGAFIKLIQKRGIDPSLVEGSLCLDPLGNGLLNGRFSEKTFEGLKELIQLATSLLPNFRIITIQNGILQDGGSSLSQELGYGMAMAVEYMDRLTDAGLSAASIMRAISFSYATGPNYFMEIAKLRAARWIWAALADQWGIAGDAFSMHIHARSAVWNLTLFDPYVNLLRTTTEAMSASLGGADTISVKAFDTTYRAENDFSSRLARNIQVILKEEAYFDKVVDPAAGSYYVEQLTEMIAEQGWKHMLEAEAKGGFSSAVKKGYIQEVVAQGAEKKKEKAAQRRHSILGVNQFPNFNESMLDQLMELKGDEKAAPTEFQPLKQFSISDDLEKLRLETENLERRPTVFLLKSGDPVWRTARAMFAGNFFGCGGYEIIDTPGFESIEQGIDAAREAGADIVVVCSSDAAYPEIGPKVFDALKTDSEVVIAGYPKESVEALQKRGIEHFVHVKTNLLETLRQFNKIFTA